MNATCREPHRGDGGVANVSVVRAHVVNDVGDVRPVTDGDLLAVGGGDAPTRRVGEGCDRDDRVLPDERADSVRDDRAIRVERVNRHEGCLRGRDFGLDRLLVRRGGSASDDGAKATDEGADARCCKNLLFHSHYTSVTRVGWTAITVATPLCVPADSPVV